MSKLIVFFHYPIPQNNSSRVHKLLISKHGFVLVKKVRRLLKVDDSLSTLHFLREQKEDQENHHLLRVHLFCKARSMDIGCPTCDSLRIDRSEFKGCFRQRELLKKRDNILLLLLLLQERQRRNTICEERNENEERQNGRGGRGDMPCSGVENTPRVPRRWCDRYT